MFLPLHDGKKIEHVSLQWVTLAIITINVAVYLLLEVSGLETKAAIALGHVPSISNDLKTLPPGMAVLPDAWYGLTTITAAFLHADLWHLGGNMLFLWTFGDNVEDAMGHIKFLVFYLVCAFAASWFHAFSFPASDAPLIGASGAAAGVVGAYLMLHPRMKVWGLFFGRIPLRLPALWVLGGWIAFQLVMYFADNENQVSWAAHVGGVLAGIALVGLLKRRSVPLFDRIVVVPEAVKLENDAKLPPQVQQSRWGRQ
ncbi:MAG: rhomboid family intramembrane serine protease [Rhizobiaceae bacterium]